MAAWPGLRPRLPFFQSLNLRPQVWRPRDLKPNFFLQFAWVDSSRTWAGEPFVIRHQIGTETSRQHPLPRPSGESFQQPRRGEVRCADFRLLRGYRQRGGSALECTQGVQVGVSRRSKFLPQTSKGNDCSWAKRATLEATSCYPNPDSGQVSLLWFRRGINPTTQNQTC